MQAYDVERSIADGRGCVESLFEFILENAGKMEAHEAEKAAFKMMLPLGLAAMKTYFAKRGTGDVGPTVVRGDGVVLEREKKLRGRDYFSIFGKFPVPRSCYRTPGETGIFPLDEQVNLPKRCYSYFLQDWMTQFDVEQPFDEGSDLFERLFDLSLSPSVLIEVARDAAEDYDAFYEERETPQVKDGEILCVGFDGKGVPVIKEEAALLQAKLGTGEKRQRKKEAVVGIAYSVEPKERTAEDLAEQLVDPEAARRRREESGQKDETPHAQDVRRHASLEQSKNEVMDVIQEEARKRDPKHRRTLAVLLDGDLNLWRQVKQRFREWTDIHLILDIMHVVSYLWVAGNALFGEEKSHDKDRWVQDKLTELLRGRVGYVTGSLRLILAKRSLSESRRKAIQSTITYFTNHRQWMRYDEYLAAGLPVATGVIESACGSLVKHRMEGNGKRWSVAGAEAILLLRSMKKSYKNDLKDYWAYRAAQERYYLYENQPGWRPNQHLKVVGGSN